VLSALSAVGETGMTLLALGLAVNLPEGRLHTILEGLVRSGQVRRRGTPTSAIPGPRTAHYHLASGRHATVPGASNRRAVTDRSAQRAADRPSAAPMQRRTTRSTGMPTTHAQGV
jgi:DNA-binding IclR family transcriptional regulator